MSFSLPGLERTKGIRIHAITCTCFRVLCRAGIYSASAGSYWAILCSATGAYTEDWFSHALAAREFVAE